MARTDEGIKVYKSNYVPFVGHAQIITLSHRGEDNQGEEEAVGEYYVLIPKGDCDLIAGRIRAGSDTLHVFDTRFKKEDWDLGFHLLELATRELERAAREKWLNESGRAPGPNVTIQESSRADLVGLALRGECRGQLVKIKDTTDFGDAQAYLNAALSVEVLSVEDV